LIEQGLNVPAILATSFYTSSW